MKPVIALFLHHPHCAIDCTNGTIRALESYYRFKIFTRHTLETNFFDDVDIVSIPGGMGDSEIYKYAMKLNSKPIKQFINNGGKYLGICMGAYWAGSHYLNILEKSDSVQYIKRPNSDTHRPHAKAIDITWNGHKDKMYFYDGCTFTGKNFKTVASYANGDPMAILQNNLGLIGCHPESEEFWYQQYSWMRPHWHKGHHHALLLDFVNDLRKK